MTIAQLKTSISIDSLKFWLNKLEALIPSIESKLISLSAELQSYQLIRIDWLPVFCVASAQKQANRVASEQQKS